MNKMKKGIALIFSAALGIFGVLPTAAAIENNVTPKTIQASAETRVGDYANMQISNGYYQFEQGAAIRDVANKGVNNDQAFIDMRYAVEITETNHLKFDDYEDYAVYTFNVVRSEDGKQVPVYSTKIYAAKNIIVIGHKNIASADVTISDDELVENAISVKPVQAMNGHIQRFWRYSDTGDWWLEQKQEDGTYIKGTLSADEMDGVKTISNEIYGMSGYELELMAITESDNPFTFYGTEDGYSYPTLFFELKLNSIYTNYFMTCDVDFYNYKGLDEPEWWEFWKDPVKVYDEELKNLPTIASETRSCYQILQNIEKAGALTTEFTDAETLAIVRSILNNTAEKTVKVEYLQQIGSTPFAEKVTKSITVSAHGDNIYHDDVCAALGIKTLTCMGASFSHFERDSYGTYRAYYLDSVHMKAITEDGKYNNYYIELGKTYDEFIDEITQNGVQMQESLFDFILNDIHIKYPNTAKYSGSQLYGFWGVIFLPKTTSVNTFWKQAFDMEDTTAGISKFYTVELDKSFNHFDNLTGYNYKWWERLRDVVVLLLKDELDEPANCILYYTIPGTNSAIYDETGSNTAGESDSAVMAGIKNFFENLDLDFGKEEEEASPWQSFMITMAVIGGISLIGLGVVAYIAIKKK